MKKEEYRYIVCFQGADEILFCKHSLGRNSSPWAPFEPSAAAPLHERYNRSPSLFLLDGSEIFPSLFQKQFSQYSRIYGYCHGFNSFRFFYFYNSYYFVFAVCFCFFVCFLIWFCCIIPPQHLSVSLSLYVSLQGVYSMADALAVLHLPIKTLLPALLLTRLFCLSCQLLLSFLTQLVTILLKSTKIIIQIIILLSFLLRFCKKCHHAPCQPASLLQTILRSSLNLFKI